MLKDEHSSGFLAKFFVLGIVCIGLITPGIWADDIEPGKQILQLHYQANPIFAAHSVAIKKGWFQEVGFEAVQKHSFSSGAEAGEALIAGELFVWTPGNMPVISMRNNGIPVVITGLLNVAYGEYLMIRNDANVQTPQDLYYIDIGILVGSTAMGVLENMAMHYGLDISRLRIRNLPPPEQVTSLLSNEIQAMLVWPPFSLKATSIATYRFDSLKFSHTVVPIVFLEDFIRQTPKAAKAILKVLLRGQQFVLNPENKQQAVQIHAEISEQPPELVEQMWEIYWNPNHNHKMIDQNFINHFKHYTDYQARHSYIKNPIAVEDYLYTDLLEEIDPEAVKIKGKWKP